MSAAAAADAAPAPKGGKKKLIIIIAAVLVLALGGVGAMLMLKKKPAEGDEEADAGHKPPAKAAAKTIDPKKPPTYVPLDMFVVNLADREAERYAQIGVTLEIDDPKTAETIKAFLPAVRNNILMVLAHKTSAELIGREGKLKLAAEVQRAAVRAMGVEVEEPEEEEAEDAKPKKKKKKKPAEVVLPVSAVHFSTFIVQ